MCGIVGAISAVRLKRNVVPILIEGLKSLSIVVMTQQVWRFNQQTV